MQTKRVLAASVGFLFSIMLAASAQDKPTAETVLATVNGTEITLGHVISMRERLGQRYDQMPTQDLYTGILEELIRQTLIVDTEKNGKQTKRTKLALENEIRAVLANQFLIRFNSIPISAADSQAAYEKNYGSVAPEVEFNASHILVETQEEAKALIATLSDGKDFAELAQEKSTGPSGPNGGSLGWFGLGAMVPAFETAVQEMEIGEVSEPVQTQFGWHVVRLNDKRNKPAPTLDDVRPTIEADLRRAALEAEMTRQQEAATIERFDVDFDPAIISDTSLLD